MSNDAASGTSRRQFLGRAAGAAAAVAGAGVGAGAFAGSAAAADQRSYTAGRFLLDIDGASVGRIAGMDGGALENAVVLDPIGSDQIQHKHIAGFKWSECTVQVGSAIGAGMHSWIKAAFDHGFDPSSKRTASVSKLNASDVEIARRSFHDALITEVTIPALDIHSTAAGVQVAVTFSSQDVTDSPPSGAPAVLGKQKAWLPANFVFQLDGVDTSRVATIDSFTWKCVAAPDGSLFLDVGDVGVTFPRASLPSWQRWYDGLSAGADDERDGTLTLVGANSGAVVTIGLSSCGVYRLSPDPAAPNTRVKAEFYVERMGWDLKKGDKV